VDIYLECENISSKKVPLRQVRVPLRQVRVPLRF